MASCSAGSVYPLNSIRKAVKVLYIVIANSYQYPCRITSVNAHGQMVMYDFRAINTMEDAYRLQGMILEDIIWVRLPSHEPFYEVTQYCESRIRHSV